MNPRNSRPNPVYSGLRKTALRIGLLFLAVGLAVPGWGRTVSYSILYTGDINGRMTPAGVHAVGGLAALGDCIDRERQNNPRTLLIDCGNFAYGSPDARRLSDAALYGLMDRLGYDAWLPGWRDWRRGTALLEKTPCAKPMLAANVRFRSGRGINYIPTERTVDGVRFVLIGLAAPNTPLCYPSGVLDDLVFEDTLASLGQLMPAVRDCQPDVVVLALDSGIFHEKGGPWIAQQIARNFPEIDILLTSGKKNARQIGALYYAAAPLNGRSIGKVALLYDTVQREVTRVESEVLVPAVDPESAEPPEWFPPESWKDWKAGADEIVGALTQSVTNTEGESGESEAGWFMARAVREALEADAVIFAWPVGRSLSAGPISRRDLAEAYPEDCAWGVLLLTPAEIRQALDEALSHRGTDKALGCYGLQWSADENSDRQITRDDGEVLHPRKRYRVAVSDDVMASCGGAYPVMRSLAENPLTRRSSSSVDNQDALVKYTHGLTVGDAGNE